MSMPSTAQLQAMFLPLLDLIDSVGEAITIRESTAPGQFTDHPPLRAKAQPFKAEELLAGSAAKQGDFKLLCRANRFPVSRHLEQKDRVVFRGREYAVMNDDANQYSIGGQVLVRVLHVRG
jgi:hypothetical protein